MKTNPEVSSNTHFFFSIHRGSFMNAHVLLNLLNELRKKDKMRGFAKHLILFPQEV